jgi:hypothetical protein
MDKHGRDRVDHQELLPRSLKKSLRSPSNVAKYATKLARLILIVSWRYLFLKAII